MTSESFSCQALVELVTSYFDRTLSPEDRERFEAHISGCRDCTNYVDQLRQTIRLTGMLTVESIPDAVRAQLLETFRTWRRG